MSRAVELVLEVETQSANEWIGERSALARRGKRQAGGKAGLGEAIADAVKRAAGIALLHPREPVTMRVFEDPGAGWRVMLEESHDGRRVVASRAVAFVPGVMLRETVSDAPLEPGTPLTLSDALPPALKDAIGTASQLAPSPALAIHRTVWRWSEPDGCPVDIALHDALDAPGSDASNESNAPPGFCELHLCAPCDNVQGERGSSPAARDFDLPEAALRSLFAAAQTLVDLLPVLPSLTDAYARACGAPASNDPVRAARIDLADARTPHEALIVIGCNVARQWFGNERGVRESSTTEFVHQTRVALRRLKTLMKTFPRWADEPWRTRVDPDLKWIGEILGQARDLDVFVETTLPALAGADVDASVWSGVLAAAEARRADVRARLQEALRSRRHAQLSLAWLDWLASLPFSAGPPAMAGRPLGEYAAKRVLKHYKRLTAKPALSSLDAAARHRRRIEAKRLRYTLEFFESLASKKTRRQVAKQLGHIQSVLGDGSDAAAALRFLEQLDVPAYQQGFARGWCEAVNRCAAQEAERLLRELPKPKIVRKL